MHQFVSSILAF